MYQLYMIHSGNDGQDDNFRDVPVAYNWLMKAISNGATFFDDAVNYFKDHFEDLAPVYIKQKGIDIDASNEANKTDIHNMHQAHINEMKNDFPPKNFDFFGQFPICTFTFYQHFDMSCHFLNLKKSISIF